MIFIRIANLTIEKLLGKSDKTVITEFHNIIQFCNHNVLSKTYELNLNLRVKFSEGIFLTNIFEK
jgi:hypothetical protein